MPVRPIKDPYLYIGKQTARIIARLRRINRLHAEFGDLSLMDDKVFELWDNIAVTLYENRGGRFKGDSLEPLDERMFTDAQNDATDLIEGTRAMFAKDKTS